MVLLEHIPKLVQSNSIFLSQLVESLEYHLELKSTAGCCFSFLLLKTYTSFVVVDIIQSLFIIVYKIYWEDVWSYI